MLSLDERIIRIRNKIETEKLTEATKNAYEYLLRSMEHEKRKENTQIIKEKRQHH